MEDYSPEPASHPNGVPEEGAEVTRPASKPPPLGLSGVAKLHRTIKRKIQRKARE